MLSSYALKLYAIMCMVIGASFYAYLVGALISILLDMDRTERDRRELLKSLNGLMAHVQVGDAPLQQSTVRLTR